MVALHTLFRTAIASPVVVPTMHSHSIVRAVWPDIAQIVAKRIRIGDRWTMNSLVCN